jgi:hypothetical protein
LLLAFLAKVDLHTIVDQKMQTKKIFLLDWHYELISKAFIKKNDLLKSI